MKPPMTRGEITKMVEEALEGGGYLVVRFGHSQMRQLRGEETETVLAALKSPPPEEQRKDAERFDFAEEKAATIYCGLTGHWVFVDERAKTRQGIIGSNGIRSCIDAAMKISKPQSSGS